MHWDLGLTGIALLAAMSLAFGGVAHLIVGRRAWRWTWLLGAAGYFLGGVLVSEVWFGWATEAELQPNIDGLSFDEVHLVTLFGIVVAAVLRFMVRRKTSPPAPQG